jgi:NitT/TauT family transport system ATP-binding protein
MSHRPGRITAEVPIPFERPRDVFELRRDPRHGEITYQLWTLLGTRAEVGQPGAGVAR